MSDKFPRQNWFRAKKLGTAWRRLKGGTSKMRKCNIGRAAKPKPGYGSPKAERHAINGEHAVVVSCLKDLDNCENKITGHKTIILSSKLGLKSALALGKEADKREIKILNRKKIIKAEKVALRIKKAKEVKKTPKEEPIKQSKSEAELKDLRSDVGVQKNSDSLSDL